MQRHHISALSIVVVACALGVVATLEFREMHIPDLIKPSGALTEVGTMSNYHPALKGTSADVSIYYFDSGKPGGTVLLLGGTHPNEPAGFIAAVVITENVLIHAGKLIVIPQACGSGFTSTDPLEGYPQHFSIATPMGERTFRFGSRAGNPVDQWPDPLVYLHYPSGQQLSGNETRNLNRSYPGRPNGSFTEQVGYAIMELIKREQVDVAFDLHEAAPEIPIINALVTHEKGRDIAASAVLDLEFEGLQYSLEMSPPNFHGLSHREWGDGTPVFPFLMETSNPIQGRLRGKTSADLIIKGVDERYKEAAELGRMRIAYEPKGEPISLRVARHVEGFSKVLDAFALQFPDKRIQLSNIPTYENLVQNGVGTFLK